MNKEKYRGLSLETKQWVYGFYYEYDDNTFILLNLPINEDNHVHRFIKVDPKTVGRYSGRNDEDGVEIYQGDIIRSVNGKHFWEAIIRKMSTNNLYAIDTIHNYSTDDNGDYTYEVSDSRSGTRNDVEYLSHNVKVIGNIHQTVYF